LKGKTFIRNTVSVVIVILCFALSAYNKSAPAASLSYQPNDSLQKDTLQLKYPFHDDNGYPSTEPSVHSPLFLNHPANLNDTVTYDPETNQYIFTKKMGELDFRPPAAMTFKEFHEYEAQVARRNYWFTKAKEGSSGKESGLIGRIRMGETFDKVFGTDAINIVPQGSAELIFGYNISRIDNPALSERNRKNGAFTFKEKIQMNVTGSIGDKMELGINYNTEATFDFENKTKLEYAGKEDEIIKKIEAGNVTLPLTGSLISGSQSLFGLKTELQFGKLTVTNVFSHQRGESSVIDVQGGAQINEFEVNVDEYDANRHFFLSHFFRDNFNEWLQSPPYITSGVRIEQIEVWVTNKTSDFDSDNRNFVAFMDLGESYGSDLEPNFQGPVNFIRPVNQPDYPASNDANALYQEMIQNYSGIRNIKNVATILGTLEGIYNLRGGNEYEKVENARKLAEREYTINRELGYISLNSALRSDEVLAVAYTYTYQGKTYRVGEISTEGVSAPDALVLKLLKGTSLTPKLKTWDLMMKNIYAIGAYQVNNKDFRLDVLYRNDETGVAMNYIKEEGADPAFHNTILLKVLDLDRLDSRNEPKPDGVFDYIEGTTIISSNGRVIFPLIEPFGADLEQIITGGDPSKNKIAEKYVFKELYDSTQTKASQIAEKNKFFLSGTYQSASSSEIQLNAMNVPRNSVKVSAGGIQLTEGIDYTVDYTLGRVKILNQGLLESGTPLRISLENNALFNLQTKTLVGTHMDYRVSDNFIIGGTLLNLTERPLTQKVNMGDEPISNTIWGLNTSYRTRSNLLTSLIDKLPLLETKEVSNISLDAEFAHLIPGQARAIGKGGVAYIDDFEGTETTIEMKTMSSWVLASTPREFAEGKLINDKAYNFNRAKLAWYVIDPLFTRQSSNTPDLPEGDASSHFVREVKETEIYREKQSGTGYISPISILNLSYFPGEKGPYNYDAGPTPYSRGINNKGRLNDPKTRWGGIMREIQTSDFETSNVEYIEFWLMDPFVYDTLADPGLLGGDLYFNLGEVSEDILRDSRKAFENGLPASDSVILVDTTTWGRVPRTQSVVNDFNTDPETRKYQDVGLDGLSDNDEQKYFRNYLNDVKAIIVDTTNYDYLKIKADPSSDNFRYYLNDVYDNEGAGVIQRYKNYNGLENNSPPTEGEFAAASTKPNAEDINRDNTLNETEAYYSYRASIRPGDLQVGKNYIVDKVRGADQDVDWYLFRIPIADYESKHGNIEDFKSIRFMRMYLHDFTDSVILRFAELHLIRGEWRKYRFDMSEGGPGLAEQIDDGSFEISAVNIEENSGKEPVNYVLPPGIDRVIDPSQPQIAELNEQSMVFRVFNLADGDAKVAYKNVDLDLRQYRKLKMFVHAEAIAGEMLQSNEITAFIRLGSDYQDNYFEYEVPLVLTTPGSYDDDIEDDRLEVWPQQNTFEIDLDKLVDLRIERDLAARSDPVFYGKTRIYRKYDGENNKMKVKGTPNLSNIRTIILGIRNPGNADNQFSNDGLPKSAEIWFNELRLTDFSNKGGWAANARIQAKLADLGTLSVAGSTIQPGFGSIEQKVNERKKEQVNQYDISTNLELGKFFPEKTKVSIPTFVGVSKSIINPEYYPKEPDRLLKDVLNSAESQTEKNQIKEISQDLTERKSINFTNVRVAKDLKKLKPLSPGNLTISVGYSDVKSKNYKVDRNDLIKYRAAINYSYTMPPLNIMPLKKSEGFNSPYLRLIKDFNFSPVPSQFTFRTDIDRYYNEIKLRNVYEEDYKIETTVNKDFTWNRFYSLQWQLTRSIRLDFSATNVARIDEPAGTYDLFREGDNRQWKDSVWNNIRNGGRNVNYNHQLNASYTLPINKIPFFNWLSASVSYSGRFSWDRGPVFNNEYSLGHTIRNSNTIQMTSQVNMMNLYSKIGFIKRIDAKYRGARQPESEKKYKTVTFSRRTFFRAGQTKNIVHKLGTQKITVKVTDEEGKEIDVDHEIISENKIAVTSQQDLMGVIIEIEGQIEKGENPVLFIAENTVRFITGLKSLTINYSRQGGTTLMGYMPVTNILGLNTGSYKMAPGLPFILGWQDSTIAKKAARNNWLTRDPAFSNPYTLQQTENLAIRGTFEPFRGFRIELSGQRTYAQNVTEYFIHDSISSTNRFDFVNKIRNGSFSITVISIGSAFEKIKEEDNFKSQNFENFKSYRKIIAGRLYRKRIEEGDIGYQGSASDFLEEGYPDGYGSTSSEVLIPAFFAAYTGKNPNQVTLDPFPGLLSILPNWSVNFDGLSRIEFFKKFVNSLNIRHSYQSTYNIGSYTTYVDLTFEQDGLAYIRDFQNNFYPEYLINAVSINERMNPLINVDITWKNNLLTRFEIGKSRILALGLANNQLTETRNNDLVIGTGYRFKEVPITINDRTLTSDLNVRLDLSVRDNKTIIRHLAQIQDNETEQITTGQRIFTINATADYVLSPRFNIQLFFDRTLNDPWTSRSFLTADTNIGFSIRFTLQ
jgi:cell surface protein SprA